MTPPLFPGCILSMPAEAANRLLLAGNGDAALLYLHLLANGTTDALSWPQSRLQGAKQALHKLALLPDDMPLPTAATEPPPPESQTQPPDYSTQELVSALEDQQAPFPFVADTVEQQLNKKLSTNDLKALYTLYDHLALPAEVILLLVTWCVEECERKYGQGRRPHMPQIRKEGFAWARQGIETVEQAEAYLKRMSSLRSREGTLLQLLDLPARPLVQRERDYAELWQNLGFDDETLRMAYEKTVFKKGTMNWSYMNAILKRWHEQGITTIDQVRANENRPKPAQGAASSSPQDSQRAQEDMQRIRRLMQQMKQEGN